MSNKKGENKKVESNDHGGGAVAPSNCRFQSCKHKITKFGFCQEHFELYMSGVIRGDGTKPVDFEKKMEQFLAAKKVA